MVNVNGINHLAVSTSDMKNALQYFNETLGFPLVCLYWMHGADNTVHAFLKVNDASLLAFVYTPKVGKEIVPGKTHPVSMDNSSARGTMHHLSFHVNSEEDLATLAGKLADKGIETTRRDTEEHLSSINFEGPDGVLLEISAPKQGVAPVLDKDAALSMGISAEELEAFTSPEVFVKPDQPVQNIPYGQDKGYRLNYPKPVYQAMVSASDQVMFDLTEDKIPPNEEQVKNPRQVIAQLKVLGLIVFHAIFSFWRK